MPFPFIQTAGGFEVNPEPLNPEPLNGYPLPCLYMLQGNTLLEPPIHPGHNDFYGLCIISRGVNCQIRADGICHRVNLLFFLVICVIACVIQPAGSISVHITQVVVIIGEGYQPFKLVTGQSCGLSDIPRKGVAPHGSDLHGGNGQDAESQNRDGGNDLQQSETLLIASLACSGRNIPVHSQDTPCYRPRLRHLTRVVKVLLGISSSLAALALIVISIDLIIKVFPTVPPVPPRYSKLRDSMFSATG